MSFGLVNATTLDTELSSLASVLKNKTGFVTNLNFPDDFITAINQGYIANNWLTKSYPQGEVICERTSIPAYFLYNRTGITSIKLPNATSIGEQAFRSCSNLASIYAPNVTSLGYYSCAGCKYEYAIFPKVGSLGQQYAFHNNANLKAVDLGGEYAGTPLQSYRLSNNSLNFKTLILRSSTMWVLGDVMAFTYSCFAKKAGGAAATGTGGTIYVPRNLVETYQNATNWSTILSYTKDNGDLQNSILAIEDSIYATQYADGTPIPTA